MTYKKFTIEGFSEYLEDLELDREITHLTLHYLWRREGNTWKGDESVKGLRKYYKSQHRKFAFHLAASGDKIWLCHDLKFDPNHSGRKNKGSIDIECDAVIGITPPSKETWNTYLQTINLLMNRFDLEPQDLYFHSELDKDAVNCPDITKDYLLSSMNELI